MIVDCVDLELDSGDEINLTHFSRDSDPDSVVIAVNDGQRLALAELTMAELCVLRDTADRMCDRGAEGGVRAG